jgi:hypothetical protein
MASVEEETGSLGKRGKQFGIRFPRPGVSEPEGEKPVTKLY